MESKLKSIFIFFVTTIFCINTTSQTTFFKSFGGDLNEYGEAVIATKDSGFLAIGATESFGNGLTDFYLIKLDHKGDFLWHKTFGGPGIDYGKDIIETPDSGFIACGYSNSNSLDYDINILKINKNGELIWNKRYGGDDWDFGNRIISSKTDPNSYYVVGKTYSYGNNGNGFILKINNHGDSLMMKTYGGPEEDEFQDIKQDHEGNLYCIGTNESQHQNPRLWISKINQLGDTSWNYYSDSLYSTGKSLTVINEKIVFCGSKKPIQPTNIIPLSYYLVGAVDTLGNELFYSPTLPYVSQQNEACVGLIRKQNSNRYYLISNIFYNNKNKVFFTEMSNQWGIPTSSRVNGNHQDVVNGMDTLIYNNGLVAIGTTQETNNGFTDFFISKTFNGEWDSTYSNNLLLSEINIKFKEINIYPNPTERFLNIINIERESELFIYDNNGRIVLQTTLNTKIIDLNELKDGMYWINIKSQSTNYLKKLIKL